VSIQAAATLILQDGVNGYAGTRDTFLSQYDPNRAYGGSTLQYGYVPGYTNLVRFAIFQSEGGPVPNGATIQSAKLSLYKSSSYDYTYGAHRVLVDWTEDKATWQHRVNGARWAIAGAGSATLDYRSTADGEGSVGWEPGWLEIDVSSGVRQMAQGQANFGWRLVPISGNNNFKTFHTRELSTPSLRPKLTITYTTAR
jgi:hypothetical protein